MQLKPQKLKLHTRPLKPKENNMKNGNGGRGKRLKISILPIYVDIQPTI
jgi:hypothetical protein